MQWLILVWITTTTKKEINISLYFQDKHTEAMFILHADIQSVCDRYHNSQIRICVGCLMTSHFSSHATFCLWSSFTVSTLQADKIKHLHHVYCCPPQQIIINMYPSRAKLFMFVMWHKLWYSCYSLNTCNSHFS